MLNNPDPEHAARGETEVEFTDLDSGKVVGSLTRRSRVPSFRARAWMSLAMIAGIARLVATVLVSILHVPKAARVTQHGYLYALRASDGFRLWDVALNATDILPSVIMLDGVIYVGASDGSVYALRANDGSVLWSYTPLVPANQLSPVVGDDLVLITLQ